MTNQTSVSSDTTSMSEQAGQNNRGFTAQGTVYASVGPFTPEWRKVVKIEMTANGPQSTVIQDYKLDTEANKVMQDAMAALQEHADSDDAPQQQQLLMAAWQALAMYLASCDDEDKAGALGALKMVSDLMNDNGGDGPTPTSTFGVTTQVAAKDAKKDAKDDKDAVKKGKNGKPLPPWMQPKKGDKASTTFDCAMDDRKFTTMGGLIAHLQSAHSMSASAAKAKAGG